MKSRLLGTAAALGTVLIATAVWSQQRPTENPFTGQQPAFPLQHTCMDHNGNAANCNFTDLPLNGDIIPNQKSLAATNKAQVVVIANGTETNIPAGATWVTGVGTGTTGAVTATIAAAAGFLTYVCSFDVSAVGGTATIAPVTATGLVGGNTLTYQIASSAAGSFLVKNFNPCIPAKAANTAVSVTTTSDGTASGVDVNIIGFQVPQ